MDSLVRRRSLPRVIGFASVMVALAIASSGCASSLDRGKVVFSTDVPSGCTPAHQVTSVTATTSVYATYVFKSRLGGETIALEVTRDGHPYVPSSNLPTSQTKGLDCFADTSDLSKLGNWGPGTYRVSLTNGSDVVAQGDLTVTGTGTSASPAGASASPAGAPASPVDTSSPAASGSPAASAS
jgi:hypothetical protein